MKKYVALVIFMIITLMSSMVFAATTTTFEVVEDNVCNIQINDYSKFEKKMISSDITNKSVTIQMKVTNNAPTDKPSGEIMLVLDNSASMQETTVSGEVRRNLVFDSAKTLISDMLTDNNDLKVGIVSFSTNTDVSLEGTIADAALVSELSNNSTELTNAIDSIATNGPRTDLDAGLTLASQHFSSDTSTNKYIIVLTDGVPNVAINYTGGYYSDDVITKTKNKLQSLSNSYNIITMLTGISAPDATATGSTYTYGQIIENIFGTTESPTAGKFYYVTDDKIEETVENSIYVNLLPQPRYVTDLKIYDYFPQQIVDNFDFAYVSSPTKGTITPQIDTANNRIIWSIDSLGSGEEAIVQYTLTLKDNFDKEIVNVILDTNAKVDITYKDFDGTEGSKTSDVTPKVKVAEPAPTILPATGSSAMIAVIGLALVLAAVSGIRYISINKKLNGK